MQDDVQVRKITHAYANLVYSGEVVGKVHITDTKGHVYGAGYTFLCAEGHPMHPRAVNGLHKMAPHFAHNPGTKCSSSVYPDTLECESELHRVAKNLIADRHGLQTEFNYVEDDPLKLKAYRSDAGKEGLYYEVSIRNPLSKSSGKDKFKYIQAIVNKGVTVIEVRLHRFLGMFTSDKNNTENRIRGVLSDTQLLWKTICDYSKKIEKIEEVEFILADKKGIVCDTTSLTAVADEDVGTCINCVQHFGRNYQTPYRTLTYHKCRLSGLRKVDPDIDPMGRCSEFKHKNK